MFNNIFFFENRAIHAIMWKDIVRRGRPQMTSLAQAHFILYTQTHTQSIQHLLFFHCYNGYANIACFNITAVT